MLAERDGHWVLARTYAEKAKAQYEELADRANVGRLLNNLGGIEFLLGKPERGGRAPEAGVRVALELGRDEDAATAVSSLAQVHLRTGDVEARRGAGAPRARAASATREDMLDEIGNARLVLGRALLEQERLDEAETALARGRGRVRPAVVRVAPCGRVDRPGRPGDRGAATSVARRCCTAGRPKRSRTSGSKGRRCSLWQPSSLFSSTAVARWCSLSPSSLLSSARSSVIRSDGKPGFGLWDGPL